MANKSTKTKRSRNTSKKSINADSSKVKNVALVYKPKPSKKRVSNKGVSAIKKEVSEVKKDTEIKENTLVEVKKTDNKPKTNTKTSTRRKNGKNSRTNGVKNVVSRRNRTNKVKSSSVVKKKDNSLIDIVKVPEKVEQVVQNNPVDKEFNLDLDVLNSETISLKTVPEVEEVKEKTTKKICWGSVIFTSVLLVFFAVLLLALFRIEVLKTSTIFYITGLLLFLVLIAILYNKYPSGKVFTLVLCAAMGFTIYRLQYTYDFVHNLNTKDYEYRPYYVIALDTNINKNINNINGKKVGMLKDNNTNIRRVLNTKLDNVSYIFFDDADSLFEAFYKQDIRAVVVGENYYKYLINNEIASSKNVKVLHEFKANTHK